ncbi:MAG: hypothetical protein Q8Q09_16950 [Deltaproteobacteria bacterium]|nr:hypothetical protein [Deltaproteobacteria bacterium]
MVINVVVSMVGACAFIAWLVALVSAVQLVSRRRPEISLSELIFRGHLFYQRDTFDAEAGPLHKRFLSAAAAFLGVLFIGMLCGLIASQFG